MIPGAEQQLNFLQHLQRLFDEGEFVATYKYALLMALAELSVESEHSEGQLVLPMTVIAEKFAELYWPQTLPYTSGVTGTIPEVLNQNQGKQTAVINTLLKLRLDGATTLNQAKKLAGWSKAIRTIARTISEMPAKYLQNVGGVQIPFLYQYPHPPGNLILHHGVASMLRTFHPLIHQLSRAGWVAHIRKNKLNTEIIGQVDELEAFMFGTPRTSLAQVTELLRKIQSNKCFYCGSSLANQADVDHFVPWVKYPRDLAHNFVLAHMQCNRQKSDMLAAERHLGNWLERNLRYDEDLKSELSNFLADVDCSNRVTYWAYKQGVTIGSHGWLNGRTTEPLGHDCLKLIETFVDGRPRFK
ncbi:MAG: HNH endonuclease [Bacteroidetes bacterium]|nr:HNH endonuclease [Bacteroidota bacterium]